MRVGDEITIEPHELVAGGAAIARVDGFPIFATNVYPGDVAVVRMLEVKKSFGRADMVRIVKPSPLRRAQPCPIAEECGGCDWTALQLDAQLRAKERILTESLRRIGKFDPSALPPITIHPSPLNYRLRSRLHRDGDALGFFAMRSHRVVPLAKECEVVGVETARQIGVHHSEARTTPPVTVPIDRPADDDDERYGGEEIWELDGEIIRDERDLVIRVGQLRYELSTRAFFQVNRHLLATMIDLITAHASRVVSRATAVDLYSGVGFFSVPLASLFARVTSVEGSRVAHHYAKRNVPKNVRLVNAPVEVYAPSMPRADFVFLDPPRAGARHEVIEAVGKRAGEMICFLSCDPVTFSRDAARLTASGWRLATLDLLDLFPNTHHVETLSSFERAT